MKLALFCLSLALVAGVLTQCGVKTDPIPYVDYERQKPQVPQKDSDEK